MLLLKPLGHLGTMEGEGLICSLTRHALLPSTTEHPSFWNDRKIPYGTPVLHGCTGSPHSAMLYESS